METLLLERLTRNVDLALSPSRRESRYLWVELVLNPPLAAKLLAGSPHLVAHIEQAATWYWAYRGYLNSLGLVNETIEGLVARAVILPGRLNRKEYNLHYREFLKGLQVLWERKNAGTSSGSRSSSPA